MSRVEGVDALLLDGRVVHIRPVRPGDADALRSLYEGASEGSRYLRFFSAGVSYEAEVRRLVRAADPTHLALVAEHDGVVMGVASYEGLGDGRAEMAIFVDDSWQGAGVGTLLLEHLAAAARRAGYEELVGDVLASNTKMLQVSRDLTPGATPRPAQDLGVVEVHLPTWPDEAALAAAGLRDRTAAHWSLRPLLAPTSVAVVGASRRAGTVGHEVLRSVLDGGFRGPVYAVNPRAREVLGVTAHPDVPAIGAPVDLALIAVPAAAVPGVIEDCAAAGVRAAVVLSAGFGEAGPQGTAVQQRLVQQARSVGLRLVGPNCLGVLNTDPAVQLSATFSGVRPPQGGLAVASQSGAVGVAFLESAVATGTGISTFVSLGNKADVSTNDLLAYWYDDAATRAVALYVESFGNPRRFGWLARTLARRKPVLAVKSGRSAAGRRAGASHTAAAAASDVVVQALFREAGVIRTDTLGELLDAARLLTSQPFPAGDRLAIVGNAGGLNVLAADAAPGAGLRVAEFSDQLQRRLAKGVDAAAGLQNPADLGANASAASLAGALATVAASGEADAVLVTVVATRTNDAGAALAAVAEVVDDFPLLPVAVVVVGHPATSPLGERRVPIYPLPEEAVRALGHAHTYAVWRRRPLGRRPLLTDVAGDRARTVVARALAEGGGWQPGQVCEEILACYGIPVVETRFAVGADEAVRAADLIGYPVVVKAAVPRLVHKSDVGAVRLNLADGASVVSAYHAIAEAVLDDDVAVAVQPMSGGGVEMVVGIAHDPTFGSVLMVAVGGVLTDLVADRSFHLLPVTAVDAGEMWQGLRSAPLLSGYRGSPRVDTDALEDLLIRVGRMAEDLPEIAELDLNPAVVGVERLTVLDVKLRLAAVPDEPDAYAPSLSLARVSPPGEAARPGS